MTGVNTPGFKYICHKCNRQFEIGGPCPHCGCNVLSEGYEPLPEEVAEINKLVSFETDPVVVQQQNKIINELARRSLIRRG